MIQKPGDSCGKKCGTSKQPTQHCGRRGRSHQLTDGLQGQTDPEHRLALNCDRETEKSQHRLAENFWYLEWNQVARLRYHQQPAPGQ